MDRRRRALSAVAVLVLAAGASIAPALAEQALQKTTVPYRTVGGRQILVDVYRPRGRDARPVIVWLHGGALIIGNREAIVPQVRALAEERNYALVSFDYRLAPETKLPQITSDIKAAFRWLNGEGARRFHLDLKRVVVAGNSAGGYLTLVTGYMVEPRPKALVSLYGYGSLNSDWYTKPNLFPEYNKELLTQSDANAQSDGTPVSDSAKRKGDSVIIYFYYRQTGSWVDHVSGFPPDELDKAIAAYEPAHNVDRNYPPTLLIHGTGDHDVPFAEAENMAAQFEQHGVPYILMPIDKGGHGFDGGNEQQITGAYATMRQFILRYLEPNSVR
jgi:acetyl esterase/lipase